MLKNVACLLLIILCASCGGRCYKWLETESDPEGFWESSVGSEIIIGGYVSNTKIPQIMGVDVRSEDPDLRGSLGQARGILERWEVTEEDVSGARTANRGAGVFYRIKEIGSNYTAQVSVLKPFPEGTPKEEQFILINP